MEVVASLSQGLTAAAQCGLFTYKSVPVIFEPPCMLVYQSIIRYGRALHDKCNCYEFFENRYIKGCNILKGGALWPSG